MLALATADHLWSPAMRPRMEEPQLGLDEAPGKSKIRNEIYNKIVGSNRPTCEKEKNTMLFYHNEQQNCPPQKLFYRPHMAQRGSTDFSLFSTPPMNLVGAAGGRTGSVSCSNDSDKPSSQFSYFRFPIGSDKTSRTLTPANISNCENGLIDHTRVHYHQHYGLSHLHHATLPATVASALREGETIGIKPLLNGHYHGSDHFTGPLLSSAAARVLMQHQQYHFMGPPPTIMVQSPYPLQQQQNEPQRNALLDSTLTRAVQGRLMNVPSDSAVDSTKSLLSFGQQLRQVQQNKDQGQVSSHLLPHHSQERPFFFCQEPPPTSTQALQTPENANSYYGIHSAQLVDYSSSSESGSDYDSAEDDYSSGGSHGFHDNSQAKAAFKLFLRLFKKKEKEEGFEGARDFAEGQLEVLEAGLHWRVCLELADLLKRENQPNDARKWYARVVLLQPSASQGWLEYAKLEEECGRLYKCREILLRGLAHCPFSESLLVKALKHEERMGNLAGARALLSRLRDDSVERTWKTILEGGLLEARAGNIKIAREVFKFLIQHVPWYGPIFNEAFRLEERYENHHKASLVVERGLAENPRYGPLWFSALRVYERMAYEQCTGDLSLLRQTVKRALNCVPKELVWKIYFEYAQAEERAGNLQRCRRAYVRSAYTCPQNLIWKVWLAGARTELAVNNVKTARQLLKRALSSAPRKMRATVLLECSRLEEYAGNSDRARFILAKAKKETTHEWRVFLECVLVEIRSNSLRAAIKQAEEALEIHTGTGRLWAVLIHLHYLLGDEASQLNVFKEALQEVPKSGEVWCEGARIALRRGNVKDAMRFLEFAIQFTPQYGDSFIEYLRLLLIQQGPQANISRLEQMCINADPNYGFMWLQCKNDPLDGVLRVLATAKDIFLNNGRALGRERPAGGNELLPIAANKDHHDPPGHGHDDDGHEADGPLFKELVRLAPLSACASQRDKWRIIFGGDPIKP